MRCLIMHSFSAQKFLNKLSWVANFEALNSQSTALSYCRQAGRQAGGRQAAADSAYTCSLVYCSARCSVSIRYKMRCKYIFRRTEALALLACFKQTNERSKQAESVCRYVQVLTRGKKCNLVLLERNYVEVSTASSIAT